MNLGLPLAQVPPADLHIPILGQLPSSQLPFGDGLEPGSPKIVCLDTALGGRALREQSLEHTAPDPDDTAVLPDLDRELYGLVLGVPMGVHGEGGEQRRLRSSVAVQCVL